jgi:radical SAM protein with 4Fe4S-binding SPASM domain
MKLYNFFSQKENYKEYYNRNIVVNSKPIIENIELISNCNLKCRMCISKPMREKRLLSFEDVKKIIDENIKYFENEYVWLHHYGEPLMHPDIIKIVSYLSSKNVNTRFSTNCMLLTKEMSEKLINAGLKEIVFAIDTMNEKKFNHMRVGADFKTVVNNINNFLNIKKEMNSKTPITQVQCINIDMIDDEVTEFVNYWKNTSVNWINVKNPSTRANEICDKDVKKIIQDKVVPQGICINTKPCFWLWSTLVIMSDGNVVLCCTDIVGKNIIGNIFENTLEEMWNSKKMQRFRKYQIEGKFDLTPMCKTCPEIRIYEGTFEEKENFEIKKRENEKSGISFNHHMLIENEPEN